MCEGEKKHDEPAHLIFSKASATRIATAGAKWMSATRGMSYLISMRLKVVNERELNREREREREREAHRMRGKR